MINRNELAKDISLMEGKKVQINIGQIKEVLKYTLRLLAKEDNEDVIKLLNKVRKEEMTSHNKI